MVYDDEMSSEVLDIEDNLDIYDLQEFEENQRKQAKLQAMSNVRRQRQIEANMANSVVASELQKRGISPAQWNAVLAANPQKAAEAYAGVTTQGATIYINKILEGAGVPPGKQQKQPTQRQTTKDNESSVDAVLKALFPPNDPMLRY